MSGNEKHEAETGVKVFLHIKVKSISEISDEVQASDRLV